MQKHPELERSEKNPINAATQDGGDDQQGKRNHPHPRDGYPRNRSQRDLPRIGGQGRTAATDLSCWFPFVVTEIFT